MKKHYKIIETKLEAFNEIYTVKQVFAIAEDKHFNYVKFIVHNENYRKAFLLHYRRHLDKYAVILHNDSADIICYAEDYEKADILNICENFISDLYSQLDKLISIEVYETDKLDVCFEKED